MVLKSNVTEKYDTENASFYYLHYHHRLFVFKTFIIIIVIIAIIIILLVVFIIFLFLLYYSQGKLKTKNKIKRETVVERGASTYLKVMKLLSTLSGGPSMQEMA